MRIQDILARITDADRARMPASNRSKKISLGFQVFDPRTGEALSEVFDTRAKPKAIAEKLAKELGRAIGVKHLESHISEQDYKILQLLKRSK